jgi:hypothetical protein
MKRGDVMLVRESKSLGTPAVYATVLRIIHEKGHPHYPDGLVEVELHDDHSVGPVDFNGYVYSGPPTHDGRLTQFP